jgi:hypothetical protein
MTSRGLLDVIPLGGMTMLKIASSEIAAPDLAPEGGSAAEAVPARLQAHAVADEAEWHRSDDVRLCATDHSSMRRTTV